MDVRIWEFFLFILCFLPLFPQTPSSNSQSFFFFLLLPWLSSPVSKPQHTLGWSFAVVHCILRWGIPGRKQRMSFYISTYMEKVTLLYPSISLWDFWNPTVDFYPSWLIQEKLAASLKVTGEFHRQTYKTTTLWPSQPNFWRNWG